MACGKWPSQLRSMTELHLVGVGLLHGLELVIVQGGVAVGHAHEQPGQPRELVVGDVLRQGCKSALLYMCDATLCAFPGFLVDLCPATAAVVASQT